MFIIASWFSIRPNISMAPSDHLFSSRNSRIEYSSYLAAISSQAVSPSRSIVSTSGLIASSQSWDAVLPRSWGAVSKPRASGFAATSASRRFTPPM